jgi:hypothetical protein
MCSGSVRICSFRLFSRSSEQVHAIVVPHATCPRESAVRHDPHPEESFNGTDDGAQPALRVGYAFVRLPLGICIWEGKGEGSFDLRSVVSANPFRPSLPIPLHFFYPGLDL